MGLTLRGGESGSGVAENDEEEAGGGAGGGAGAMMAASLQVEKLARCSRWQQQTSKARKKLCKHREGGE